MKERMKVQQRLFRPSGIPVFTVIFTVKFLYLQIPSLLLLLPNSITSITVIRHADTAHHIRTADEPITYVTQLHCAADPMLRNHAQIIA